MAAISTDNGKLAVMEWDQDYEPGLPALAVPADTSGQATRQQLLWGFPEVLWSAPEAVATTIGGVFRRLGSLSRAFGRLGNLSRVFRGLYRMGASILYDTRVKDASETIAFVFDYSRFPEVVGGETLSSPEVDDVAGLTIGTAVVTTEDEVVDEHGTIVAAGMGVKVTISGGTAAQTYPLESRAVTSGGSTRVVKGSLVVE